MLHQTVNELITSAWFNTEAPISLEEQRGKVILIFAFQMLCPGCVSHSIPQAIKVFNMFSKDEVTVIGLHTVFEHHEVMNMRALKAFIHEYQIPFPVAIDMESKDSLLPQTMTQYQMQGTPSLIVIDKQGYIRLNHFGRLDDMLVGKIIGELKNSMDEEIENTLEKKAQKKQNAHCNANGCTPSSK